MNLGREISKEEKVNFFKKIIATGLYTGYIPIAPATFSCLISVVVWYVLKPFDLLYVLLTLGLLAVGVVLGNDLSTVWGKDPREIVIDEYAAFLIPLYFTPVRLVPLLIAFIAFRLFDILKPPPLRSLERLRGGWGIMLDDIGAAVYTTVIVLVATLVFNL
ncbi:MAG: phosphatidylglycerophosphatase A [candidate division WOR-3 bacterium]|nr:MAG: phosphatidylglycerophosphatase A [candidate division WOR-3 bacterium]